MKCKIEQYTFFLEDDGNIMVYVKSGINVVYVIKPDKPVLTQKQMDQECTDWWFKNGRN